MIKQQVLLPDSDREERERLQETIAALESAQRAGDPTGNIAQALDLMRAQLEHVTPRLQHGLVDYDPRVHG